MSDKTYDTPLILNTHSNRREFLMGLAALGAAMVFPGVAVAFDGKGEGTARLIKPSVLVAGKPTCVLIEFTAGASGIPVGGGIWLGVHHAAIWNKKSGSSRFQSANPKAPSYIGVVEEQSENFQSVWYSWAPDKTMNRAPGGPPAPDWSHSTPLIYHQCVQAKVKNRPIKPGEKILLTIGTEEYPVIAPISVDKGHEFFVAVNDGKGIYRGIGKYPKLDLVADEPHHLIASAQMIQEAGKPFELLIRAEDKWFNTATSFRGSVTVTTESGKTLARDVLLTNGLARLQITLEHPGPERLRLVGGGIEGRGEPIIVFAEAPRYRVYYGDTHGHTRVSDGCGEDAVEYFRFGREEANLDVCALADHWHYDWEANKSAVKAFYEPGKYVTFLAEEAGTNFDHINLYFLDCDAPHTDKYHIKQQDCHDTAHNHYMAHGYKVIGGPHHFAFDRGEKEYPWIGWDSSYERFAEIVSNHGTSEFAGNPNPLSTTDPEKTMQAGLAKGRRFGVIGSSDTHVSRPGRSCWLNCRGGMAVFLAPELTREAIWDAWWNYRVYAAEFDRIYIDFRVNDQIMGSDLKVDAPAQIQIEVVGADDDIEVVLVRNNQNYRTEKSDHGIVRVTFQEDCPAGQNFYYVRVTQKNGQRAWSTPVWIARA